MPFHRRLSSLHNYAQLDYAASTVAKRRVTVLYDALLVTAAGLLADASAVLIFAAPTIFMPPGGGRNGGPLARAENGGRGCPRSPTSTTAAWLVALTVAAEAASAGMVRNAAKQDSDRTV